MAFVLKSIVFACLAYLILFAPIAVLFKAALLVIYGVFAAYSSK